MTTTTLVKLPVELSVDVATLILALFALLAWALYRRKREQADKASADARAVQQLENERKDRLKRDRADAAALHSELTSREVSEALGGDMTAPQSLYIAAVHERVDARHRWLFEQIDKDGQEDPDQVVKDLMNLTNNQLQRMSLLLARDTHLHPKPETASSAANGRDFSKYTWDGRTDRRQGKYAMIALIAAAFAKQHEITDRQRFNELFGAEVEKALNVPVTPELLLDEIDHAGQRERYVQRDLNWKAQYGYEGVLRFDGKDYRTAWTLGATSGQPPQNQLLFIDHFIAKHSLAYPITRA